MGNLKYLRLPQGYKNSPFICQWIMDIVTKDIPEAECYFDDLLIATEDNAEIHKSIIKNTLQALKNFGLKISPEKYKMIKCLVCFCDVHINEWKLHIKQPHFGDENILIGKCRMGNCLNRNTKITRGMKLNRYYYHLEQYHGLNITRKKPFRTNQLNYSINTNEIDDNNLISTAANKEDEFDDDFNIDNKKIDEEDIKYVDIDPDKKISEFTTNNFALIEDEIKQIKEKRLYTVNVSKVVKNFCIRNEINFDNGKIDIVLYMDEIQLRNPIKPSASFSYIIRLFCLSNSNIFIALLSFTESLNKIQVITSSHGLTDDDIHKLEEKIDIYFNARPALIHENHDITLKEHLILHYAKVFKKNHTDFAVFSSKRFKSYNKVFKNLLATSVNYINIPYSCAKRAMTLENCYIRAFEKF
ncbi:Reverse transcriptase domain-containing protein [Strongyloides ratti]|uniref:Reverse transcriptase domain-containing protein n=1 Tax=Strongyloides ratti TaxID=34506 RepID=A0A090MT97_STRRB|nr:Reverse transcriptase domain-containing protein [Strongyloides ratti]CEF61548.1 Reverse transcriptase domain-containing protein [Strongyloides ratti]